MGCLGALGNSKEKLKKSQEVSIRDNPYGYHLETVV
nr:MAG TPA: KN motif [Caudoviricetes sp.]